MKRYILFICTFLLAVSLKAQSYTYHYWFDTDIANMQSGSLGDGHLSLDVATLEPGLHWLNLMLKDETCSVTDRYLFCKIEEPNVTALKYWFDENDTDAHTVDFVGGTILIDVNALSVGEHILTLQLINGTQMSVPESYTFDKIDNAGVTEIGSGGFVMYPNPANDFLSIETTKPINSCNIYNIDGSLVCKIEKCSEKMEINVENLPSGTYIIKIDSGGLTQNRVFVKK